MLEKLIFLIRIKKWRVNILTLHNEEEKPMAKVRSGDVLSCEVCGLTVIVDEECGCATIDIICCEEPMVPTGVSKLKLLQAPAEQRKSRQRKQRQ